MNQPAKLLVATPLGMGTVWHPYVTGLLDLTSQSGSDWLEHCHVGFAPGSIIHMNRGNLTRSFYEGDYTHCLWIDSDIKFSAKHAKMLLETGKDFISGLYPLRQMKLAVPVEFDGGKDAQGLLTAKYVPGGFLLTSRNCIQKMITHYPDMRVGNPPMFNLWDPIFIPGKVCEGEDISFCRRWREMGEEIWVHPECRVGHMGAHLFEIPEVLLG